MRADRFLPVAWERAGDVIGAARRAGKRIVGIEDSGTARLGGRPHAAAAVRRRGGEADGVPRALLARCDVVTRIPMAGSSPRTTCRPPWRSSPPSACANAEDRDEAQPTPISSPTELAGSLSLRRSTSRRAARARAGLVFVLVAAIAWLPRLRLRRAARQHRAHASVDAGAMLAHAEAGRWIAIAQLRVRVLLAALFCRGSTRRAPTCARSARAGCASAASGPISRSLIPV
jgi:hypothetical protein